MFPNGFDGIFIRFAGEPAVAKCRIVVNVDGCVCSSNSGDNDDVGARCCKSLERYLVCRKSEFIVFKIVCLQ